MEKVKVTRYVSGRRPEYAQSESESESSDEEEEGLGPVGGADEEEGEGLDLEQGEPQPEVAVSQVEDRRLRRLRDIQESGGAALGRWALFLTAISLVM